MAKKWELKKGLALKWLRSKRGRLCETKYQKAMAAAKAGRCLVAFWLGLSAYDAGMVLSVLKDKATRWEKAYLKQLHDTIELRKGNRDWKDVRMRQIIQANEVANVVAILERQAKRLRR